MSTYNSAQRQRLHRNTIRIRRLAFTITCNRAAARGNYQRRDRAYRQIARLWDWIDHVAADENPEDLWQTLADTAPWAFWDPNNVNTVLRDIGQATDAACYLAATRGY